MEVTRQNSRLVNGKFIGKGSYGVVKIGFRDEDVFAIKSAEKNTVSSVEALENEINVINYLSSSSSSLSLSPFIVKYYGEEETTSSRSLLMEYLPGGDVARGGKVDDVELIRSYTWCLVEALRVVHEKKIVHCDVKGSNLLVGPGKGVVKLADFGSAKRVGEIELGRGSPLWMAPEVVRGEFQGFESDVWSIGCTLIEMFTGKPAWEDNGAPTLFKIGYSGEMPEYPPQVCDLGQDFLDKCLSREPSQRWRCDKLLDHPFLVCPVLSESTPRSILDWDNLDFSDVSSDDDHESFVEMADEVSAKGRIGELATGRGVNWESDGWIEVRNVVKDNVIVDDEITTSVSGLIWDVHNEDDYPTWINSSIEINDVENIGGDDGGRCGNRGSIISRQVIKTGKNTTLVTLEILLLLNLLLTLYCPTSIEQPNVTMSLLLLIKLIRIHCFWIKSTSLLMSSIMFTFCLFLCKMPKRVLNSIVLCPIFVCHWDRKFALVFDESIFVQNA